MEKWERMAKRRSKQKLYKEIIATVRVNKFVPVIRKEEE